MFLTIQNMLNKAFLTGFYELMIHPYFLDVWNNLNKGTNTLQSKLTGLSTGIFIVAIILGAILLIGGRSLSETAKSLITKALIATALVAMATVAIPAVKNLFK
ncbi:hypothetical protein [Lactobacillus sp. ESL0681]|uniref:hypothetical protein n=1 Tax=Lactobacillus sp. ESL0681 TaxID=2983211 RepID=UPI0023F930A4|nr:hypothetical protein [Lactobacillus sp. ESL0681]WEV41329.1 hypothetical protein OZX59_09375 [Lactobacillus sp. ESL0681]